MVYTCRLISSTGDTRLPADCRVELETGGARLEIITTSGGHWVSYPLSDLIGVCDYHFVCAVPGTRQDVPKPLILTRDELLLVLRDSSGIIPGLITFYLRMQGSYDVGVMREQLLRLRPAIEKRRWPTFKEIWGARLGKLTTIAPLDLLSVVGAFTLLVLAYHFLSQFLIR